MNVLGSSICLLMEVESNHKLLFDSNPIDSDGKQLIGHFISVFFRCFYF
jgi:hypothetical protein